MPLAEQFPFMDLRAYRASQMWRLNRSKETRNLRNRGRPKVDKASYCWLLYFERNIFKSHGSLNSLILIGYFMWLYQISNGTIRKRWEILLIWSYALFNKLTIMFTTTGDDEPSGHFVNWVRWNHTDSIKRFLVWLFKTRLVIDLNVHTNVRWL